MIADCLTNDQRRNANRAPTYMMYNHFCNATLIWHVPHHCDHAVLKWSDQRRSKYNRQVTWIHLSNTVNHIQLQMKWPIQFVETEIGLNWNWFWIRQFYAFHLWIRNRFRTTIETYPRDGYSYTAETGNYRCLHWMPQTKLQLTR